MIVPGVPLVILDPPLLDLITFLLLSFFLILHPRRILEHRQRQQEFLVVLQGKKDILILIDLTPHIVDLVLKSLVIQTQSLLFLFSILGLLLLLFSLNPIFLNVFHQFATVFLKLEL